MDLAQLFISTLEGAGNRLLRLDPEAPTRLAGLQGKVVHLQFKTAVAPFDIYLMPAPDGIRLTHMYDRKPDVSLRATPAAFLSLKLPRSGNKPFFSGDIEIEGDLELGQRFQRVFGQLDIDWEEQLSRLVGDVAAHQLGNLGRGLRAWSQEARAALRANLGEYLHEEARLAPKRREIEAFLDAVDRLRADGERLAQRLQRIMEPPR